MGSCKMKSFAYTPVRAECKQFSVASKSINSQSAEASSCLVYRSPEQLASEGEALIGTEQVKEEHFFINRLI